MAERVVLRDGTPGWVWPLLKTDRAQLVSEFHKLSAESIRRRFLGPVVQLTETMLHQLVDEVDGIDHVALVLIVEQGDATQPIAIGRVVRYPDLDDAADLAVTVKDEWQGRGVASVLLPVLVAQRPARVTRLLTQVGADNPASLAMLKRLGPIRTTYDDDGGGVEVEVQLVPTKEPRIDLGEAATQGSRWREHLQSRDLVCPWLRRDSDQTD